jgi:hypothetical protein
MQETINGYVGDALKALFWQVFGLLSWSQWAVLILVSITALSVTLKLPGMLLGLFTLPFRLVMPRLTSKKANHGLTASLMTFSLFGGAALVLWWKGGETPPPPQVVVVESAPARRASGGGSGFKWPDLSGVGKKMSDWLSQFKLPELKEDPDRTRREEEQRLAELKRRQAEEAAARAEAKRMAFRAKNEWAKWCIQADLAGGWWWAAEQDAAWQREMERRALPQQHLYGH